MRALRLAATLAVLVPCAALAIGETGGTISGYVLDPGGQPMAGVPLTLNGPALMRPQTRETGANGRYSFDGLQPGPGYSVSIEIAGFAPQRVNDIVVRLGQATPIDLTLEAMGAEVTVSSYKNVEAPNKLLNPETAQTGAVVDSEKAAQTPIFHQVEGMPQQVAGVGPGNRPSTRGGLARWGKFYVDGMDTTDVTDGSITAPMNFDAVENFEIITGGFDAQYNSMGMVENAVTKTGSNRFTYDTSLTLSPAFMTAKNSYASVQNAAVGTYVDSPNPLPQTTFYSPVLNLGGPIVKDRLWFYASGQINDSVRETPLTMPYGAETRPTDTLTKLGRLKLTWQPTDKDRVSVAFNYDHNTIDNNINSPSTALDAEQRIDRGGYFFITNYDRQFRDNLALHVDAGLTYKNVNTDPEHKGDLASHSDTYNGYYTQFNAGRISASQLGNYLDETKTRLELDPTLTWKTGPHEVKGGVQASYMIDAQTTGVLGNSRYYDKGSVCDVAGGNTAGCYQRIDFYTPSGEAGALTTRAHVLTEGFFIQDKWFITRKLTLVPGLRFDMGQLQDDTGKTVANLMGFGPRLSATYDIFGDRKTLVTAHYGRSNDVGNVYVAQHANPALLAVTSTWNGVAFPDCTPTSTSTPGCSISGGVSGRVFAQNQTAPHVDEVSLGLHHELTGGFVGGVDGDYRRYSNLWADEEINRIFDPTGTVIVGYQNGVQQSILRAETAGSANRQYAGVDLWVQGKPGRWDLLASYTLGYNWGTVSDYFDGYLADPRMAQWYAGYLPDDHRHTLKGSIAYSTSFGLDLGFRVQYRTGAPMWESFDNPADPSLRLYRSPRGTGFPTASPSAGPNFNDPGSWSYLRDPSQFLVDLQVRYNLGRLMHMERKVELVGLLVNALNNTDPVALYDSYYAPSNRFGDAIYRNSPMQAELLIRVRN